MFLGQSEHNLDSEGWVALPPAYLEDLQEGLVVTRGLEQNLLVYSSASWEALAGRLVGLALTDAAARLLRRRLFAAATALELDAHGRIQLPPSLRAFAGLEHTAICAGQYDCFEIWEPDAWTAVDAAAAAGNQDQRWRALGI